MLLKQKKCENFKGRGCAFGRNKSVYNTKKESISPNVTTEYVLLSWVIDAK